MIRSANITFDFDTESGEVTNLKCNIQGETKKKTSTVTKSSAKATIKGERDDIPIVIREDSKLVFNQLALTQIGVDWQERILIKLEKTKAGKMIPVIASSITWGSEDNGNKLSKTGTVVYKGKNNEVLAAYGDKFTLEEYDDGIFQLVPLSGSETINSIEEAIEEAKKIDPILIVDSDDTTDIDEFEFKL